MRPGPSAARQADHRHHRLAPGARPGRHGLRHHRPAGVRRSAGPRHLHSVPGHRHAAHTGRPRSVHGAQGPQRCHQGRVVCARDHRRGVRRVPRLRGRGGPTTRGDCGQLQRAAHLGQRRAGGRRLRRDSRRHRHARAGEEASGRRCLHRPEGGRPAGTVGSDRRRHAVHHHTERAEAGRDGARRAIGPGLDHGPRGSRQKVWSTHIGCLAALPSGRRRRVDHRHRSDRHPAAVAPHRRHLIRRRLQPRDRAGGHRRRIHRQLLPVLRRQRGAVRLVSERARGWRRSARPGCGCRPPATAAAIATWLIISRCAIPRLGRRIAVNRVAVLTAGAVFLAAWLPFNNGLRPEPLIAFGHDRRLGAGGERHRDPAAVARGDRDRRGVVQRHDRAAGAHRAGSSTGRRARHRTDHSAAQVRRRGAGADRPSGRIDVADLRDRLQGPDAGHRRRVRPHQVRRGADHRLVSGVPALLLPDCRGQRRLVADPPLRRARDDGLPVRDDRGAAAPRPSARRRVGPGVAADRHDGRRAAALDVHADEVGRPVRCVRWAGRSAGSRHRVRVRPRRSAHPAQPRARM